MNGNVEINLDLLDLYKILKKRIILISTLVTLSAIFSIFYSLSFQNTYKSNALLQILDNNDSLNKSGLSSYASIVGINLDNSSDLSSLIVETIKSRDFFSKISLDPIVLGNLMAAKSFDTSEKKIIYNEAIFDINKKKWIEKKPSEIRSFNHFENKLEIGIDKDSGFIKISFEHISPIFAKEIIEIIIEEVNLFFKKKDYEESTIAIEFLQNKLLSTQIMEMKQSISKLIPGQIEAQMKSEMREDYVLSYIETPFVPEDKAGPNRALICILGTLVGFLFSLLYVLATHYLSQRR